MPFVEKNIIFNYYFANSKNTNKKQIAAPEAVVKVTTNRIIFK